MGWELDAVEFEICELTVWEPVGAEFTELESAPWEVMGTEPVGLVEVDTVSSI